MDVQRCPMLKCDVRVAKESFERAPRMDSVRASCVEDIEQRTHDGWKAANMFRWHARSRHEMSNGQSKRALPGTQGARDR